MPVYDIEGNEIVIGEIPSVIANVDTIKTVNHRGWKEGGAVENTMNAFNASLSQGYTFVETDIRFTSDGVCVLLHDESINRIAYNSDGSALTETINIADITYEQALTYKFGSGANATNIATLQEFAEWCKVFNVHPYVEIKAGTQAQVEAAYDICQKEGITRNMSWISPNTTYLQYIVNIDPTARFGYLYYTAQSFETMKAMKTNYNHPFISQSFQTFGEETAQIILDEGFELEVWTLNRLNSLPSKGYSTSTAVLKWLTSNGCTGITSDDLHAQAILQANYTG